MGSPEVDQSTFGKEDDVAARGHGVSVDLRLNVDVLDGGLLQPSDINFDVEMSDAVWISISFASGCQLTRLDPTYLQTIASSGMASKCFPTMMSRHPVVVTKMLAREATSSIVLTS